MSATLPIHSSTFIRLASCSLSTALHAVAFESSLATSSGLVPENCVILSIASAPSLRFFVLDDLPGVQSTPRSVVIVDRFVVGAIGGGSFGDFMLQYNFVLMIPAHFPNAYMQQCRGESQERLGRN
jgi:hypothetical protein